jgi:O-antigen biosynthesis protein
MSESQVNTNSRVGSEGSGDTQVSPESRIAAVAAPPLVSILIPCCGMIEYTKLCVPSLLRYTRPPYELIFLDVGSLDGTTEYLAGIRAASSIRIEVVRTRTDLEIPSACKEAVALARGEYLLLLNNDTVVSDGWLQQLTGLAGVSPAIGMVGPMSNYAAPPQLVETVSYRIKPKRPRSVSGHRINDTLVDVEAVHAFAREFREKSKGKWVEVERLGGFCLLIKQGVLERIGVVNINSWGGLGLFDTDILSVKAREAGFTLACCRDLFIHHFGTRTFSHGAPGSPSLPQEPEKV